MNDKTTPGQELADRFIVSLLQHQPELLGPHPLSDTGKAQQAAHALAAFRQALIRELDKQPGWTPGGT